MLFRSKISIENKKGRFEIRMENISQTLNKNRIDNTVKSYIKNISELNIEKNKDNIYPSMDDRRKKKKKLSNKDNNRYYDIYLEKKKKKEKDKIPQKMDINEDNNIFQKIKEEKEKERETNIINNSNDNDNKININEEIKESNRNLIKKRESEEQNINNELTNKEKESSLGVNINNFFKSENNKKENLVYINKNRENEENKNNVIIYPKKNNNIINVNNNLSRNAGRQLNGQQNSDTFNKSTNNLNQNISNSNYKIKYCHNNINIQIKRGIQRFICSICGITYTTSISYVADCERHFLCKKCAKCFYEEKIENGAKELFCPFINCGQKFSKYQVQKFVSKRHYNMLEEEEKNDNLNSIKFFNDNNYKNIKNYSENHVIDVNNNKLFYNFNKNKKIFCSKCNKETLFCRDKQLFMRCLNCSFAQCKYCFKEYTYDHFDMNSQNYCRIYYRGDELYPRTMAKILKFLIQLFLVFAIFCLTIISLWKVPKNIFKDLFFKKNKKYNCFLFCIKIFSVYFFTFIIFIICLPFNILLFPWFPSILALSDY